jgi:hypothetical protein
MASRCTSIKRDLQIDLLGTKRDLSPQAYQSGSVSVSSSRGASMASLSTASHFRVPPLNICRSSGAR